MAGFPGGERTANKSRPIPIQCARPFASPETAVMCSAVRRSPSNLHRFADIRWIAVGCRLVGHPFTDLDT